MKWLVSLVRSVVIGYQLNQKILTQMLPWKIIAYFGIITLFIPKMPVCKNMGQMWASLI